MTMYVPMNAWQESVWACDLRFGVVHVGQPEKGALCFIVQSVISACLQCRVQERP